jgi:polysaccharide export outer membrane protein
MRYSVGTVDIDQLGHPDALFGIPSQHIIMGHRMTSGKRSFRPLALCSAFGLCLGLSGAAQQPASNLTAAAALQAFEGTGSEEYTLGCGDQISVMVVGHAEATGKQTVGPDGIITMPYAGGVKVSDLTRRQAADAITKALAPYYENPSVVVGVDVYSSNNVVVLGAVEHPGLMPLESPMTLLSVVSKAGLALQTGAAVQGKPIGVPERVAVFRGNRNIMWIDFKQLLENADPELQMHLKKDDVIYIPSANERYVSVFGEVLHPGLVQLQDGSTLAQLLAEAGGIVSDHAGRYPKIQIIHEFKGSIDTVDYETLLQSRKPETAFETGDIIYVPESKFNRFSVTLQKISPLISIATVATLIEHP